MVPDETFPNITNCIGVVRGLIHDADNLKSGHNSLEVALLRIPDGYCCADLSLYKVSITRFTEFFVLFIYFLPQILTSLKPGRTNCVAAK